MSLFKKYIKIVIQESNNNEEQKKIYLELLKHIKDENFSDFKLNLKKLSDINISFDLYDKDFKDYKFEYPLIGYPLIHVIILSKMSSSNKKQEFIGEILSRDDLNLNKKDPHDEEIPINDAIKQGEIDVVEQMLNSNKINLSIEGRYGDPYNFASRRNPKIQELIKKHLEKNNINLNNKNEPVSSEIQQDIIPKINVRKEINLSEEQKEKLIKSSIEKNTRIIQGSFITASTQQILNSNQEYKQKIGMKPNGLWFSRGNEWIKFMIESGFLNKDGTKSSNLSSNSIFNVNTVIKFNIKNKKMYYIENDDKISLEAFIKAFGVNYSSIKNALQFNWPILSSNDFQLDGIFINNDQDRDYSLINTWDIPSGCLWNLQNMNIEKITSIEDYLKNYYSSNPQMI